MFKKKFFSAFLIAFLFVGIFQPVSAEESINSSGGSNFGSKEEGYYTGTDGTDDKSGNDCSSITKEYPAIIKECLEKKLSGKYNKRTCFTPNSEDEQKLIQALSKVKDADKESICKPCKMGGNWGSNASSTNCKPCRYDGFFKDLIEKCNGISSDSNADYSSDFANSKKHKFGLLSGIEKEVEDLKYFSDLGIDPTKAVIKFVNSINEAIFNSVAEAFGGDGEKLITSKRKMLEYKPTELKTSSANSSSGSSSDPILE